MGVSINIKKDVSVTDSRENYRLFHPLKLRLTTYTCSRVRRGCRRRGFGGGSRGSASRACGHLSYRHTERTVYALSTQLYWFNIVICVTLFPAYDVELPGMH